jgi:hypothetical protein
MAVLPTTAEAVHQFLTARAGCCRCSLWILCPTVDDNPVPRSVKISCHGPTVLRRSNRPNLSGSLLALMPPKISRP